MLQNLLVERFGLAVHRETRELPIYELVVAKGGLKMKEAEKAPAGAQTPPEPSADGGPPNLHMTRNKTGCRSSAGRARDVSTARERGRVGHRPNANHRQPAPNAAIPNWPSVVDKTGVTGIYDFNLRFAPESAGAGGAGSAASAEPPSVALSAASDPAPSLFTAFEASLG